MDSARDHIRVCFSHQVSTLGWVHLQPNRGISELQRLGQLSTGKIQRGYISHTATSWPWSILLSFKR